MKKWDWENLERYKQQLAKWLKGWKERNKKNLDEDDRWELEKLEKVFTPQIVAVKLWKAYEGSEYPKKEVWEENSEYQRLLAVIPANGRPCHFLTRSEREVQVFNQELEELLPLEKLDIPEENLISQQSWLLETLLSILPYRLPHTI